MARKIHMFYRRLAASLQIVGLLVSSSLMYATKTDAQNTGTTNVEFNQVLQLERKKRTHKQTKSTDITRMTETTTQNSAHTHQSSDLSRVDKFLSRGALKEADQTLASLIAKDAHDDQARFELGLVQFLEAVQELAQDLYRFGLKSSSTLNLPILRIPLPENTTPELLTYEQARNIMLRFLNNLMRCESTLAQINRRDVKVPLHFGLVRLDLNGDGQCSDDETLWRLYSQLNHRYDVTAEKAETFYIKFDRGDVHWLRGYCHLLSSICEIYLAHDTRETFERTAHLFFTRVDSPYSFLVRGKHTRSIGGDTQVIDIVALIHLIRWRVVEPVRMTAALAHLEAVVDQSHESWKHIMAETDDDHEWLPNPKQTGVIPGVHVTQEMVDSWQYMMTQAGKVLRGELLVPFWRAEDARGINVRRVFLEQKQFDLVLWVQGTEAAPYLEEGTSTDPDLWPRLQRAFGRDFPGFAIWFN